MKDLSNKFLITMPHLNDDPVFGKSMIFICEHNEDGAMGIIINKPIPSNQNKMILSSIGLEDVSPAPVAYFGGPVGVDRSFILHTLEYNNRETLEISKDLGLTNSIDILSDIKDSKGPADYRLVVGYAGWDAGQIEDELDKGDWMLMPSTPDIFQIPDIEKWKNATSYLGIDVNDISGPSGIA